MGNKDENNVIVHTCLQSVINYWNEILCVSGGTLKSKNAIGILLASGGTMDYGV